MQELFLFLLTACNTMLYKGGETKESDVTPQEIYDMEPESISHDVSNLMGCYYNHIHEVSVDFDDYDVESDRIEIRTIKYHSFDGRRFWRLSSIWFDGAPIMITQNAGREGDDHAERFITDGDGFKTMCSHIASLIATPDDVIPPDVDVPNLDSFYGYNLAEMTRKYPNEL